MGECCLVFREEYSNIIERFVNGVLLKTTGQGKGRKQCLLYYLSSVNRCFSCCRKRSAIGVKA
jgi:hypothetical protein